MRRVALALLWLAALGSSAPPSRGAEPALVVIVAAGRAPAAAVSTAMLANIFTRKRLRWPDGSPAVPVNLPAQQPLRRAFSLWMFGRSPEDMQPFWDDQYYHGVLPPPVLASEEAVLRFVAETPGAVGYVSVCAADRRVQVLATSGGATCTH